MAINIEARLRQVVPILQTNKLFYALVGGVASSIYRAEPRTTLDVDFVLETPNKSSDIAVNIIRQLGLKDHIIRKADLDGGPMFAIKRRSSPEMMVVGRDVNKLDAGLDFLLLSIPWAERALKRAQVNKLDFGFDTIPTITVEDLIIAKLFGAQNIKREDDISDIRSIFAREQEIDLTYIVSLMSDFGLTIPDRLIDDVPISLQKASQRIKRRSKTRSKK